jgi:hypothetical protein
VRWLAVVTLVLIALATAFGVRAARARAALEPCTELPRDGIVWWPAGDEACVAEMRGHRWQRDTSLVVGVLGGGVGAAAFVQLCRRRAPAT